MLQPFKSAFHSAIKSNNKIPFLVASNLNSSIEFPLIDHLNNEIATVQAIDKQDISKVCYDSQLGFQKWSSLDINKRISILEKFKSNFINLENDFQNECLKIGIPDWFALFNFSSSVDLIDNAINNIATLDDGCIPVQRGDLSSLSMVFREPIGPVMSISSWNAPVCLTMRSIMSPLLAGCSVLVKSAEQSASISYLICKAFIDAGAPLGTLQLIHTDVKDVSQIVDDIITNENIRMVNFTGSTVVGAQIAKLCGANVKPFLLELGGKNSTIIQDDVKDLTLALSTALGSAWAHKGQICMCTDRVFVHESLYDDALEILTKVATEMGSSEDQKFTQRNSRQSSKVHTLIDDLVSQGAKVLYESEVDVDHPNFVQSVVLTDVPKSSNLSHTESFGPQLAVIKYSDINDLIAELNLEQQGLSTAIWSSNHLQLIKLLRQIQSGAVHINGNTVADEAWLPHGGVKQSGVGRFNGRWGIESFSYWKTVTLSP